MAKIERKYMAHYIDAALPGASKGSPNYVRLGKDLEEYSPELSANVEKKQNILGESSIMLTSYEKSGSVEPYYAEKDDPLFARLQGIIDECKILDDCNTTVVEVHLWEEADPGKRLSCGKGRCGNRGEQLRRRFHRLPDSLQPALQRQACEGPF